MEGIYEELDEAKAEIEKLKAECRSKAGLSESLKKANSEQLLKIQDASSKIEKQTQELNEKAEEISMAKKMCEDLKCSLNEKESIIKHLRAANDKLRVECDGKSKILEGENRGLVLALDEANEKNLDQEQKIHAYKEEIEGLKGLLSVSQKKCLEAEKKAKAVRELRERDDVIFNLEERSRKVEDQLKWKKEQFKHLEEAHEKLRDQFKASKKEWEKEKSTLLDGISSLQMRLDSQTRIAEDLQSRLQICNQALAHEESRRKYLEVQVSEFQSRFECVFSECEEAKMKVECLNTQRDKEVAALRNSLGTKETLYKDLEYQAGKLEQENRELLISLKELREAQIHEAGNSSSLGKLRNKLKSLEHVHRDCSSNLGTKEAEWSSQLKKLIEDLDDCKFELESKITAMEELGMQLDSCNSLIMKLKLQNEEMSVMLLVIKSGISEAQLKLENDEAESDMHDRQREESVSLLKKQLEMKNTALVNAQMEIEDERQKAASLLRRIESFDLLEEQQLLLQKKLEKFKEMLEESSRCQLHLKEQALQMESDREKKLREVCDALDQANSELAERICEGNEIEFELQIWKSIAERLKANLEESQEMRRELETSLLAQVEVEEAINQEKDGLIQESEEKDRRIDNLRQQIALLEQELKTREIEAASSAIMATEMACESVKESFLQTTKEKDQILEVLQREIGKLEQESLRRELEGAMLAHIVAEGSFEHENEKLVKLVEEKEKKADDILQVVRSLEQNFNSSLISFSSQLAEKQAEINLIHDAYGKITAAEILAQLEIEEKKLMIVELEDDILSIQNKLEVQEKSLFCSKQQASEIEAELEEKELEMKKLTSVMEGKLRSSDALINELKSEKRNLIEDIAKLSAEREKLVELIEGLGDRISKLSSEDIQLMGLLGRIEQSFDTNVFGTDLKGDNDELFGRVKENMSNYPSPVTKKPEAISDGRSPFRELNN